MVEVGHIRGDCTTLATAGARFLHILSRNRIGVSVSQSAIGDFRDTACPFVLATIDCEVEAAKITRTRPWSIVRRRKEGQVC